MSLPNDVCRCVNDTCPLRERCLRWQAFIDDRERKEEGAYISYARFEFWTYHGECERKHECDHIITGRL